MAPKYRYYRPFGDSIVIINQDGERKTWGIDALRTLASSSGMIEELRDMARGALKEYGLLEEPKAKEEPASDTIVTIDGVKVYKGLFSGGFFARFRGTRLYGSLSDLERKIRGGG